jgi:Fe-S oxidoreductase
MNPLIDKNIIHTIRSTGDAKANLPDRIDLLRAHSFPYDLNAESVIITGCQILGAIPQVLRKFIQILDRSNFSYTFLSKEYCCGNTLYRPAIKAKDEEAITECRSLSKEFIGLNIERAKELGSRRIIIFCSPCYPIYKHAFPGENIVFYPHAINETITAVECNQKIDYYAGCYKLHKRFAPVPMDLKSTDSVFKKIQGLSINQISAPDCCYKPDGLNHMINNVKTDYMVHICTGCYFQALLNMPKERHVNIMMLPEFIDMLQEG